MLKAILSVVGVSLTLFSLTAGGCAASPVFSCLSVFTCSSSTSVVKDFNRIYIEDFSMVSEHISVSEILNCSGEDSSSSDKGVLLKKKVVVWTDILVPTSIGVR